MVTLRRFNFMKDIRAIMALELATFGNDAFPAMEFLYLQRIGGDTFLMAHLEQNFVGYVSAYIEDNGGYIASLAVDGDYRRRGIARMLMYEVIRRMLVKKAISYVQLHVRQSNEGAITFYKDLEFEIIAVEEDYYPDEDAFVMRLYL